MLLLSKLNYFGILNLVNSDFLCPFTGEAPLFAATQTQINGFAGLESGNAGDAFVFKAAHRKWNLYSSDNRAKRQIKYPGVFIEGSQQLYVNQFIVGASSPLFFLL